MLMNPAFRYFFLAVGLALLGFLLWYFSAIVSSNLMIFSMSVRAHPLEIFLVILIAGTLAGIPGMILGIPGYTVIRVFAKEFPDQVRIVKKLTSNI